MITMIEVQDKNGILQACPNDQFVSCGLLGKIFHVKVRGVPSTKAKAVRLYNENILSCLCDM